MSLKVGTKWTSIRLTDEQREYIERRAVQRSQRLGLQVGMADVVREAVDLLMDTKPVNPDESSEKAAS